MSKKDSIQILTVCSGKFLNIVHLHIVLVLLHVPRTDGIEDDYEHERTDKLRID